MHKLTLKTFLSALFYAILLVGITMELIVTAGQVIGGYNLSYVNGTTSGFIEFSLCLAICMPVLLHLLLKLLCRKRHRTWSRVGGVIIFLYLLGIAAIMIASKSRASWVAAIVGCAIVGYCHLSARRGLRLDLWHKLILLLLPFLLAVAFYSIKKDSADGRMLIWKVTLREVVSGNVTLLPREENFSAFLGDAQERYFSSAERPWEEQRLAGGPDDAYNEYLQILVEDGLVVFVVVILLLLFVVWVLWKSKDNLKVPLAGSFASITILSFFSYPLRCPTSLTLILFVLATCCCVAICKERARVVSLCVAYIGLAIWFIYKFQTDQRLERAIDQSRHIEVLCISKVTDNLLCCYQNLYPFLNDRPEYLLAYSKALLENKDYDRCNMIINQAKPLSGDPVFHIVQGKCMEQQKLYSEAEVSYLKAYNRVPHRIYPLFLLMSMYRDQGLISNAKKIAIKISGIKPKIPSAEFYEIQDSARAVLNSMLARP